MCAEKVNETLYSDHAVLIDIMTAIGVVLFVIVVITLIVAYFYWKRRMKVQEINFTKNNNNLQSWSHHRDHGHQQPTADVSC